MNITLTHLKEMVQEALDEGKPGEYKKRSKEYGERRKTDKKAEERRTAKEEAEEEKKLHRGKSEQQNESFGDSSTKITVSSLREMIKETFDEILKEKCKGRGCATPSEVDDYAKAIEAGSDSAEDPYAVAWKSAREPGSKKGRTVAEEKK